MAESPPSQQSWAAWFLDAYANSVVPTTSEESQYEDGYDSAYGSTSPASATVADPSVTTTNDAASAYGPYVKTGRGGSGNYRWDTAPPTNSDIEGQRPRAKSLREKRRAAANVEHIDTSAAVSNSKLRQSSQYVRVGRGGAGNMPFIQSNEIQHSPASATYPKSPLSASSAPHSGRGGAGNFAASRSASDSAKALREKEEQEIAEQRREDAEKQVSEILRPPTQAWLGGRRRSWIPPGEEEEDT